MAGAGRLVLDEGKTIGAVARELDLTPSSLANWVRHARAGSPSCENNSNGIGPQHLRLTVDWNASFYGDAVAN